MFVLRRQLGEAIVIDDRLVVTVDQDDPNQWGFEKDASELCGIRSFVSAVNVLLSTIENPIISTQVELPLNEEVEVSPGVWLTAVEFRHNYARLGIRCGLHIPVHRKEVHDAIHSDGKG